MHLKKKKKHFSTGSLTANEVNGNRTPSQTFVRRVSLHDDLGTANESSISHWYALFFYN